MRAITYIAGFYMNPGMWEEQHRVWADYPADLKRYFHAIVTDDGSPKGHRLTRKGIPDPGIASIQTYRTGVDVRWNWLFCRNLGVSKATTDWVLLTDIDHVLPVETLRRIVCGDLETPKVYRLSRIDAPHRYPWCATPGQCGLPVETKALEPGQYGEPGRCVGLRAYKPHPNTWLMTRRMFDAIGGYDERLSGCYGTDGEFRDRVEGQARAVVMLKDPMVRYPRDVLPDASTTVFTRKGDPANDADLRQRREARDRIHNWKPLRVTFPYEPVL